jgi:predicted phosphoadenosine phosphosulfate sulfurtransferase
VPAQRTAAKRALGIDVLTAAKQRIARVFSDFPRVYLSFSGGKDSGVMLELAANEARRRGRRLGVLIVDLEAQYELTIDYVRTMLARHADVLDVYWVALPLNLRNAVSHFEPQWTCWDPQRREDWVRPLPHWGSTIRTDAGVIDDDGYWPSEFEPATLPGLDRPVHGGVISDPDYFPFYRTPGPGQRYMEFEEFVPEFGRWYAQGQLTACLVGIRTQESLNRWRTIASVKKRRFEDLQWTTWINEGLYNAYPIYDWQTEDIWRFYGKTNTPYNALYDRMHKAGLTIHQMRICQPYGDDQRRGLWLYHVVEPHTWARVVARVAGADFGAEYANTTGNILGRLKITKPAGMTWEQFAHSLLDSMPGDTAEHYRSKIAVFLRWYETRGYPDGIPDEGSPTDKKHPSWTRICSVMLKFDYWCKGLSFSPTKPEAYLKYRDLMAKRRALWQTI